VANGDDYDPYVEKALGDSKGPVVISAEKSPIKTPGLEPKDTSLENEHLFFNFAKVDAVARGLADELAKKDPQDKDSFQKNVNAFDDSLYTFADQLKLLGEKHPDLKVAQTESVGHYLAAYLGAVDVTPAGYRDAVAKEVDPSAADEVAMENLLKDKGANLLLSNPQDENKTLDILIAAAKQGGVPDISIGETPTDKENTYQVWVGGIVSQFTSALGGPALPSDYHHEGDNAKPNR
jgi:zinc/manganese transport system substrate-binding protein